MLPRRVESPICNGSSYIIRGSRKGIHSASRCSTTGWGHAQACRGNASCLRESPWLLLMPFGKDYIIAGRSLELCCVMPMYVARLSIFPRWGNRAVCLLRKKIIIGPRDFSKLNHMLFCKQEGWFIPIFFWFPIELEVFVSIIHRCFVFINRLSPFSTLY